MKPKLNKLKTQLLSFAFLLLCAADAGAQANCSSPSTGFAPINDLGTGISPVTGLMGGLYPNGSNFLPSVHKTAGLQMASQVLCLDTAGNPDAVNGKIVWLSIGMSNASLASNHLIQMTDTFSGKNPKLFLVNGAVWGRGSKILSTVSDPKYAPYWNTVNARLVSEGVTASQVQVIWFKQTDVAALIPVQEFHDSLVVQFKRIMKELKQRFPNVKLCYMASRIYGGYAPYASMNPEPYAYWQGWACKKVIEDQINVDPQLNYSGTGANSPWIAWGTYNWADGATPRSDGLTWLCPTDFLPDLTHPSYTGADKVAQQLLNFFSSDSTATPWFLGTGCPVSTGLDNIAGNNNFTIYPNPVSNTLYIRLNSSQAVQIEILNVLGEVILSKQIHDNENTINVAELSNGIYFIRLKNDLEHTHKFIKQ